GGADEPVGLAQVEAALLEPEQQAGGPSDAGDPAAADDEAPRRGGEVMGHDLHNRRNWPRRPRVGGAGSGAGGAPSPTIDSERQNRDFVTGVAIMTIIWRIWWAFPPNTPRH